MLTCVVADDGWFEIGEDARAQDVQVDCVPGTDHGRPASQTGAMGQKMVYQGGAPPRSSSAWHQGLNRWS